MISYQEPIWKDGEYNYEAAYGFVPNIYTYLHDDDEVRPCMLIVPGGGYCMVCNVEGEPTAKTFCEMGMNAIVLTYTTDITMSVPLRKTPLNDISRAVRYVRANAERFHIDPNKITIIGFSAGGHLCASLVTHYDDIADPDPSLNEISNRPDGAVLCYPVITASDFTHKSSIESLVGYTPTMEELDYFSLENHVTPDTPQCFVWQTVEDEAVPVKNSEVFASALRENNVPYAYYAFPNGLHGMSVCSEDVQNDNFGEPYTFDQLDRAIEAVRANKGVNVSDKRRTELMIQFFGNEEGIYDPDWKPEKPEPRVFYDDVCSWPKLCESWLRRSGLL